MPRLSKKPIRCLEAHPTSQSVRFAGMAINLSRIQRAMSPPLDHSYLSRIFAGERTPSTAYARMLAAALGMTLQSFLEELDKVQERAVLLQSA